MGLSFALRGDSFTPRFNGPGGPGYGTSSPYTPVISADGAAIGGSVINQAVHFSITNHNIYYNGVGNWPTTIACSVLMRVKFRGLSGVSNVLWGNGSACRFNGGCLSSYVTATNLYVRMYSDMGQSGINNVAFPHTMGTSDFHDIVITFTGDTTTNGCEVFIDGVSIGTTTSTRAWNAPRMAINRSLGVGIGHENVNNSFHYVNEFSIWDEVIDPTNVALTTGSGSLNGVSRTAFVDVAEFDGSASSGGSIAPMKLGGFGF